MLENFFIAKVAVISVGLLYSKTQNLYNTKMTVLHTVGCIVRHTRDETDCTVGWLSSMFFFVLTRICDGKLYRRREDLS